MQVTKITAKPLRKPNAYFMEKGVQKLFFGSLNDSSVSLSCYFVKALPFTPCINTDNSIFFYIVF